MAKKRVPPGGEWVLLAGKLTERSWSAVVYTLLGEPVAAAIDEEREGAVRAALGEALGRARPVRVLAADEVGLLEEMGLATGPLGDEHEELVERFAEHLATWRADADEELAARIR